MNGPRFTGSWLHKGLVRLCVGMMAILGIKLSALYLLGAVLVFGLHRDHCFD